MKVIKLDVNEDHDLEGIDAVALVENPAIEIDFQAFSEHKFQSFNDYPKQAIEAAEQGIKRNKELGNKCGTLVGKQRAQQLAKGENVTLDTIKRMRSFLLRQKDNYDLAIRRKDYEACGYISYLLWGGPSALPWAEKKLRQAGLLEASNEEIIRAEMSKFADVTAIEGIPVFDNPEEALALAKKIGCEGSHEHKIEGSIVYMPCKRHSEATDLILKQGKYFDDLSEDKQDQLLNALDTVGLTEADLEADGWVEMSEDAFHNHLYFAIVSEPEKGSLQDTSKYRVLYKYSGPKDSKNRTFCRDVLNKNLLFRLEDINNLSLSGENQEFGTYDIFVYKGSYNCRHAWVQKFYKKDVNVEDAKRATTSNSGPREVIGGPRTQEASQTNPKSRTLQQILDGVPEGQFEFSAVAEDKQLLAGPLMIPEKLIPRINNEGEKYYVFFDKEGIQRLAYKMIKNKFLDSVNIEHDPNRKVDDISLVETWLVEDPKRDKSNTYGYELPSGSWFGIYKVNNKQVWDDYIKTGRVKGFSVEGIFADKIIADYGKQG